MSTFIACCLLIILQTTKISTQNIKISTPEECLRTCDGKPRICQYNFTLEIYNTLGGACQVCKPNGTISVSPICQCILADGVETSILTVNRMLPGPSIQVCEDDLVVVNVKNDMDSFGTTIHWHGIHQHGTQYSDGVPGVSQCPIPRGGFFRYQWKASPVGSHFWHSHSGFQILNGIRGPLIIRQEKSKDPNNKLYDFDLPDHIMFITDFLHKYAEESFPGKLLTKLGQHPDNVLINGKGRFTDLKTGESTKTPLEIFTVEKGKRFRFRMIDAMVTVCPVHLFIENHIFTIVALDGAPIKHVVVDSIVASSGHRFDFVINADKEVKDYWVQLKALGECGIQRLQQFAILRYKGGSGQLSTQPSYDGGLPQGKVLNPYQSGDCHKISKIICVNQLEDYHKNDKHVLKEKPDLKINLPFKFQQYTKEEVFAPNTYNPFLVTFSATYILSTIAGYSNRKPSAPLLSQYKDTNPEDFCYNKPKDCGKKCFCIHKINIPLNQTAEIILMDETPVFNLSHSFHMHGNYFHVLDIGNEKYDPTKNIPTKNWPKKDTVTVPSGGYAVIRFKADNPGFWFFHCHFQDHMAIGMSTILHVGELSDLPPVPRGFPKCGDYSPEIYTNLI